MQLKRVVNESFDNVLMYRRYWDKHGRSSYYFDRLDDLKKIPVINKASIRSYVNEDRISRKYSENTFEWRSTSGSTGEPFRFPAHPFYSNKFFDRRYTMIARQRYLLWEGFSLSEMKKIRLAYIGFSPYSESSDRYLFLSVDEFRSNPYQTHRKIVDFKPTLLEGVTTVIEGLAQFNELQKRSSFLKIPYVTTFGESLGSAQRRMIQSSFSSKVYNLYGLEELGVVGIECSSHKGFHISEESYFVEILDSTGHSAPNGVFGKVVITSFFNYVLPFIRYDTGDEGMISEAPCLCGNKSRLLFVRGRQGGYIKIGNKDYSHMEVTNVMDTFSDIVSRYQIVKKMDDEIEIKIIPSGRTNQAAFDTISKLWKKKFNYTPRLVLSDIIMLTRTGKAPVFINEGNI